MKNKTITIIIIVWIILTLIQGYFVLNARDCEDHDHEYIAECDKRTLGEKNLSIIASGVKLILSPIWVPVWWIGNLVDIENLIGIENEVE